MKIVINIPINMNRIRGIANRIIRIVIPIRMNEGHGISDTDEPPVPTTGEEEEQADE